MARASELRQHLEGWQLGLLAVGIAACALWLAVPRPVEPRELPLPEIDRRVIARERALDAERLRVTEKEALPFDARAVGELLRRHGAAVVRGDSGLAAEARNDARRLSARVLAALGAEPLLRLRALQTELFSAALVRFERSGKPDRELDELGANFPDKCRSAGWLDARGRLTLSAEDARVLYRMRWTELVGGLEAAPLRPLLDEFRLYYQVLLQHPEGLSAEERDQHRLAYVAALARVDTEFPSDLARGVLLYRLGRPEAAYAALSAHLATHAEGPWAMRAKNYALAALAEAEVTE